MREEKRPIRLSLCMIVRDSARTLPACLASIAPWVDEMVVVDTGSLDETRTIAVQHGAKVFEFPWCDDFAKARNESLRRASGHWLFWMDSDDVIDDENGRKLRELANGPLTEAPTAYVMQVHCPGPPGSCDVTVVDHVKMFRNLPELRFEGRIHEQILPAVRRIDGEICWTDVFVVHAGAEHSPEARRRKQQRDLRLLELELADHPDHPFVLFNLGMTYADMDELAQAAEFLRRCLDISPPEESHVRKAYALLVGCMTQLNQDDDARSTVKQGLSLFPNDAELLFRLGILEHRTKNYTAAVAVYEGALEDAGERRFSSRDRGIAGYKARHNLATIFLELGSHDLAELQWRFALEDTPTYSDGWRGLVATLLETKKYVSLEAEIEKAAACGNFDPIEILIARARLKAALGDVGSAVEILDEVKTGGGGAVVEHLRLKCEMLFELGETDRTIAGLEELCRLVPDDGASLHNLGTAHQKAGHLAIAASYYHRSLAIRPGSLGTLNQLANVQRELGRDEASDRTRAMALAGLRQTGPSLRHRVDEDCLGSQ